MASTAFHTRGSNIGQQQLFRVSRNAQRQDNQMLESRYCGHTIIYGNSLNETISIELNHLRQTLIVCSKLLGIIRVADCRIDTRASRRIRRGTCALPNLHENILRCTFHGRRCTWLTINTRCDMDEMTWKIVSIRVTGGSEYQSPGCETLLLRRHHGKAASRYGLATLYACV